MRAAGEKKGIRLITMSRAGYGGSTRNNGRRVVDVVGDIEALTGHPEIRKCVVGGWSGGGNPSIMAYMYRSLNMVVANQGDDFRTPFTGLCSSIAGLHCLAGRCWPGGYHAEGLDLHAGQGKLSQLGLFKPVRCLRP